MFHERTFDDLSFWQSNSICRERRRNRRVGAEQSTNREEEDLGEILESEAAARDDQPSLVVLEASLPEPSEPPFEIDV